MKLLREGSAGSPVLPFHEREVLHGQEQARAGHHRRPGGPGSPAWHRRGRCRGRGCHQGPLHPRAPGQARGGPHQPRRGHGADRLGVRHGRGAGPHRGLLHARGQLPRHEAPPAPPVRFRALCGRGGRAHNDGHGGPSLVQGRHRRGHRHRGDHPARGRGGRHHLV